ncbi:MAG: hypothetical protein AAF628_20795 [Planctomycetota bacterium]
MKNIAPSPLLLLVAVLGLAALLQPLRASAPTPLPSQTLTEFVLEGVSLGYGNHIELTNTTSSAVAIEIRDDHGGLVDTFSLPPGASTWHTYQSASTLARALVGHGLQASTVTGLAAID